MERLVGLALARPRATLAVSIVLAVLGGALALGLRPSAGTDTLVGKGSPSARATSDFHRHFGDEAIVVLVREKLPDLVDTSDLGRLIRFEGCLGGNVPRGQKPYGAPGGPCWQLAATKPARVVYGPGTFLLEAVNQIQAELASRLKTGQEEIRQAGITVRREAAARGYSKAQQARLAAEAVSQAQTKFKTDLATLALQSGLTSIPTIDNKSFINQVVFDPSRGAYTPKSRFAYLFPGPSAALVQVRLKPGLSDRQRTQAIRLVRAAIHVTDPKTGKELFRLARGGTYTVTGVPVVVSDLAGRISHALVILLLAAGLVMALTLALVFRVAPRLLPLGVALGAAGLTFGALRLVGGSLTMATVAVLPVLIGLAVDYAVQFQSRVAEAGGDVRRGAAAGGPTIATAGLATATGFLVLVLSPVPMVRGFGLVLVFGVGIALLCAFTGGAAALALTAGPRRRPGRVGVALASARRGARDLLAGLPGVGGVARGLRRGAGAALRLAVRRPERVLAAGFALALCGWVLDTQTAVVSDVTKLVPQNLSALRDVRTLQNATGITGEVDVVVKAKDITQPAVINWMTTYQKTILRRFHYAETRGCGHSTLCPALSLPDLFASGQAPAQASRVRRLLASVPTYFSQAVITSDRTEATLAFGIRLESLARQQAVLTQMVRAMHPPPGVSAHLAGLPVLAAEANDRLSDPWRRLGTLVLGLILVGLALGAVFRSAERAIVPLIPIALATGWAALVVAPIALNPMSATLGALVIAISTEFSVLLSERYRQERGAGRGPDAALARAYRLTGAAVLASGVTAIAGFAVLALSEIAMVRNFGIVAVVDLGVALLGVLFVLPAVLVLAERGALVALPRRALAAIPRRASSRRRRATVA